MVVQNDRIISNCKCIVTPSEEGNKGFWRRAELKGSVGFVEQQLSLESEWYRIGNLPRSEGEQVAELRRPSKEGDRLRAADRAGDTGEKNDARLTENTLYGVSTAILSPGMLTKFSYVSPLQMTATISHKL